MFILLWKWFKNVNYSANLNWVFVNEWKAIFDVFESIGKSVQRKMIRKVSKVYSVLFFFLLHVYWERVDCWLYELEQRVVYTTSFDIIFIITTSYEWI